MTFDNFIWFWCTWVMWWSCVVPHDIWLLILLFIYFLCHQYKITKKIPTATTSLPSWCHSRSQKTSPLQQWQQTQLGMVLAISFATGHSGSCSCIYGCSAPLAIMLTVFLLPGVGRRLQSQSHLPQCISDCNEIEKSNLIL